MGGRVRCRPKEFGDKDPAPGLPKKCMCVHDKHQRSKLQVLQQQHTDPVAKAKAASKEFNKAFKHVHFTKRNIFCNDVCPQSGPMYQTVCRSVHALQTLQSYKLPDGSRRDVKVPY